MTTSHSTGHDHNSISYKLRRAHNSISYKLRRATTGYYWQATTGCSKHPDLHEEIKKFLALFFQPCFSSLDEVP